MLVQPIYTFYAWGKGGGGWLKIALSCGVITSNRVILMNRGLSRVIELIDQLIEQIDRLIVEINAESTQSYRSSESTVYRDKIVHFQNKQSR